MPTTIDDLQIEINAKAQSANSAIDRLVIQLDKLSTSLGKIDSVSVSNVGKFANRIEKLSQINFSQLNSTANSLSNIANAFEKMNTASSSIQTLEGIIKNISKLNNKSVQSAIQNMPLLSNALNNLFVTLSKSPSVSTNVINMTNALANLASQGNNVGKASKSIVKGINQTHNSMKIASGSSWSLASAFGKFYANYFMVIRGVKKLWSSIEGTTDYIEALNYQNVAFEKISSEWDKEWEKYSYDNAEAYADSFTDRINETLGKLSGVQFNEDTQILEETGMKNLGLNLQEITQYASQLASVTNSVGQTGEVSLATADAFTKLAGDMSSLFNVDYSSVAKNLQSGLIGQSRALYKYGIDITNATLQTYAYELGLEKAVSEMTQAEKMQLRMLAILDQSKVSWGDLANTINSPSNMIRQFTTNLKEAGMVLGQLFLPLLEKVLPVMNGVSIATKRLLTDIAGLLGVEIDPDKYSQGYTDLGEDIDGITDSLDDVTASAKKAKAGLRGFDELNVINMGDSASGASGGGAGSIDLTQQILDATEEYNKVWQDAYDQMENRAQEFADNIYKYFDPISQLIEDISIGDWFAVGEDVSGIATSIFDFFSNAIANVDWYNVGVQIGNFLNGIDWDGVLESVGQFIWNAINAAIDFWKGAFDTAPVETGIITGFAFLKLTGVGGIIVGKIKNSILKKMGEITSIFTKGGLFNNIGLVIENLFSGLSFKDSLVGVFGTLGTNILGITTTIGGAITAVTNFVDMLKNGFSWFNEILMVVGVGLTAVGAIILGAPAAVAGVVAGIVAALGTVVVLVKDNWEEISGFFEGLWSKISEVWGIASSWFNENVITPTVNFFVGFGERVSAIFEGVWILVQAAWKIASEWFNSKVVQPIIKTFSPVVESVSKKFRDLWDGIKSTWKSVSEWFRKYVTEPIGGFFEKLWSGVRSGVVGAMNGIIGAIEKGLNWLVYGINNIIGGFNRVVSWAAGIIEVDWEGVDLLPEVTLNKIPISGYYMGGFPTVGDLFYANERGVELIATKNGRPAVASNGEVTGITSAIYSTAMEEKELMREQNQLLRAILEKEFGISKNDIGRAARDYAREYTERTKKPAYTF